MAELTPEQRSLRARYSSYVSWANTDDPAARTQPARTAFMSRFERQVDPDGKLDPADRARRAEALRKAYFARLAYESAKVRRAKRDARARKSA